MIFILRWLLRWFFDENHRGPPWLFSTGVGAPRQHGKTIKARMMQLFFGVPRDENNRLISFEKPHDSPNYKFFENTKIAERKDFVNEHFGKYPVLYADFSRGGSFSSVSNMDEVRSKVKQIVSDAYQDHEYLCTSKALEDSQRLLCKKWCDCLESENMKPVFVKSSLVSLLQFLLKHHEKQVFIILDEVDSPCVHIFFSHKAETRNLYEDVHDLLVSMLNPIAKSKLPFSHKLKSPYVKFYMTGISFVLTGLSSMNTVHEIKFLCDARYAPYYGFLEENVEYLCRKLNLKEIQRQEMLNYHGYTLMNLSNQSIFHPVNCLLAAFGNVGNKRPHFQDLSHVLIEAVLHDEEALWTFEHLFLDREVEYHKTKITKAAVTKLKNMMDEFNAKQQLQAKGTVVPAITSVSSTAKFCVNKVHVVHSEVTRVLMMFLAELGCFKYIPTSSTENVRVKFPNPSVKKYFQGVFTEHYIRDAEKAHVRLQIQAAIQIESLVSLAALERTEENTNSIKECLTKLTELFKLLLNAKFKSARKSFNEKNVVSLFEDSLKKIPKAVINLEFSMLNKSNQKRFIDILTVNKEASTWDEGKLLIVTEVKVSNLTNNYENTGVTALKQVFDRSSTDKAKRMAKYTLVLGVCVVEPKDVDNDYECEFASVSGASKSLSANWEASAIYSNSLDIP